MNATFRLRRTFRNQGLGFLPVFLAWFGGNLYLFRVEPTLNHQIGFAILVESVPLFMAGLSAWMILAYWREELTIQGDHVIWQGVFQRKEIDLNRVTTARWRTRPGHEGSVVLRTDSTRLVVYFSNYEPDEQAAIGEFLRSALAADIQVNWNLFSYQTERRVERSRQTKPGPDEIVLRRDRWDRFLWPSLALMGLVGIAFWRILARPGFLALPVAPLIFWAMMRFTTPAEGMIARKVSVPKDPETIRSVVFLVIWFSLAFVGLGVHAYLRPGMQELDAPLIIGALAWLVVLFVEGARLERRRARQVQEAADLAAKGRGEAVADSWDVE